VNILRAVIVTLTGIAMLITQLSLAAPPPKPPAATFTPQQKTTIEQIVHDYLLQNPEILVEVSQALQQKERKTMMQRAEKMIPKYAKQLFHSPGSPVSGNRLGTVTLVEFFDYQCIHCREMVPTINALIKKNKNLRVVYKEFPIFGSTSEFAAKASLAAVKQKKFDAFHEALFKAPTPLTKDKIIALAASVGLDTKQLQRDIKNLDINQELKQNYRLAQALGIIGTPAIIVVKNPYSPKNKPYFVPGQVSEAVLQHLINEAKAQQ